MGENDAANNGSLDGVGDNIMVTVGTTRRVSAPSMDGFAKKPQSAFASVAVEGEPVAKPPGSQEEGPPRQYRHCGLSRFIRPQLDTHLDLSFVVLAAVVYGVLFFSIGTAFLPGHPAWATLLLWASSLTGAFIAHQLYLPRVIGMLAAGILLQNVPWSAIDAFPTKWGVQMRAAALATIFLRCGLELDFGTMRRFKYPALRLALVPGLVEALFDAGLGTALFDMPFTLSLCMGFILKAVGPGLVVPAMFRLQRSNLGTDEGIPSTVVIAASFDDVIAITGYAIFSTIAIQPEGSAENADTPNPAWTITSGPVQVIFGILGGLIAGYVIGATRVWNTSLKRFVALFGSALLLMFFLEYYELLSGGALGALFTGLVASNLWERGSPHWASLGPSYLYSPEAERAMSVIWRWVMEPILFVTVGSTLNFDALSGGTIPRAVVIVCAGVTVRTLVTYVAMMGFDYTWKEKLFYAIAWTPKATVQAALSAAPLALINSYKTGAPDYEQWVTWGNDILTTGLFAIIICGTLGVLAIHFSAPVLLQPGTRAEQNGGGGQDDASRQQPYGEDTTQEEQVSGEEPSIAVSEGQRAPAFRPLPTASSSATTATQGRPSGAEDLRRHPPSPQLNLRRVRSMSSDAGYLFPARPQSPSAEAQTQLVAGEDLALVAEYIESIRHLTTALRAGEETYSRDEVLRLSDRVLHMQHRVESEVGHREPSVRELFRTAAEMVPRPLSSVHRGARSTNSLYGALRSDSVRRRAGRTPDVSAENAV